MVALDCVKALDFVEMWKLCCKDWNPGLRINDTETQIHPENIST